jgi:hypothetical protein
MLWPCTGVHEHQVYIHYAAPPPTDQDRRWCWLYRGALISLGALSGSCQQVQVGWNAQPAYVCVAARNGCSMQLVTSFTSAGGVRTCKAEHGCCSSATRVMAKRSHSAPQLLRAAMHGMRRSRATHGSEGGHGGSGISSTPCHPARAQQHAHAYAAAQYRRDYRRMAVVPLKPIVLAAVQW